VTPPEFSRPVKLDQIGTLAQAIVIEASEAERAALAKRFNLVVLRRLMASLSYARKGSAFAVTGKIEASYSQPCIASAVPVPGRMTEVIAFRFVEAIETAPDAEIELSNADCDVIEHDGQTIDLGEAVAQSLGLALDPYPRSPDADGLLKAAGVKGEGEVGAFAGLAGLRDKLRDSS
jgi:uncharacterized metal-binding protein YceD (DUF177 family)